MMACLPGPGRRTDAVWNLAGSRASEREGGHCEPSRKVSVALRLPRHTVVLPAQYPSTELSFVMRDGISQK